MAELVPRHWEARTLGAIMLVLAGCPSLMAGTLSAALDGQPLPTLAPMLERVMPAVVNIATKSQITVRQHPLLADPFFRRFFGSPQRPLQKQL